MSITDQPLHVSQKLADPALAEIERIIASAREGEMVVDDAFEAIGRVVSRRARTVETYQKPWG